MPTFHARPPTGDPLAPIHGVADTLFLAFQTLTALLAGTHELIGAGQHRSVA